MLHSPRSKNVVCEDNKEHTASFFCDCCKSFILSYCHAKCLLLPLIPWWNRQNEVFAFQKLPFQLYFCQWFKHHMNVKMFSCDIIWKVWVHCSVHLGSPKCNACIYPSAFFTRHSAHIHSSPSVYLSHHSNPLCYRWNKQLPITKKDLWRRGIITTWVRLSVSHFLDKLLFLKFSLKLIQP